MMQMGYEIKNGKNLAFRKQGKEQFIRLCSLGEEYSEEALRAVISGKTLHKSKNISKQIHTQRERLRGSVDTACQFVKIVRSRHFLFT